MSTQNCVPNNEPDTPFEPAPATIPDHQSLTSECAPGSSWVEPPCDSGDNLQSNQSQGQVLGVGMTDARCAAEGEGLTLISRVGNVLAKFVGNGFLQIKSGKAYLVSYVPISIKQLWHQWLKPSGALSPILSDPQPFPYGVIADEYGRLYGIQGFQDADTIQMWDFTDKMWVSKRMSELPIEIQKVLPNTSHLELVGFEEVPVINDPETTVRVIKALQGSGVVYLEKTTVGQPVAGCPEDQFAYVAKVLEFPALVIDLGSPEATRHQLIYSTHGFYWEAL